MKENDIRDICKTMTKYLKENLSEKRYRHTIGVSETAERLAGLYGCDESKARIAGLAHDCVREAPRELQLQYVREAGIEADDITLEVRELLHGPAAVHICRSIFGVEDEEILSAVRYHTTGREDMTILEKIIFLADFIEPGRDFKGVEEIREQAFEDLDKALLAAYDSSIAFLIAKAAPMHMDTIKARNFLLRHRK